MWNGFAMEFYPGFRVPSALLRQGRHDPIRNYGVGLFRTGQAEADMANFVLLSKAKYMELLEKYGFHSQAVQLSLFDELKRKKGR